MDGKSERGTRVSTVSRASAPTAGSPLPGTQRSCDTAGLGLMGCRLRWGTAVGSYQLHSPNTHTHTHTQPISTHTLTHSVPPPHTHIHTHTHIHRLSPPRGPRRPATGQWEPLRRPWGLRLRRPHQLESGVAAPQIGQQGHSTHTKHRRSQVGEI